MGESKGGYFVSVDVLPGCAKESCRTLPKKQGLH